MSQVFTPQHRKAFWLAIGLLAASGALLLLGVSVGSTGFDSVLAMQRDPQALLIVSEIRLPRTLGAWLAGALLGLAGAVAQGLFRNPLADPYLLGSASGASLGVALAMALFGISPLATHWLARIGLTGAAFVGAVLAVLLTLLLARGVQHTLRLLLAGVIVGVVLGAITSLVLLLTPEIMQAMQSFMLGSTAFVGLAAPHLVRSVVKTTHGRLIALASLMGAVLLTAADILARGLVAPQELPVGVLTAVLGGTYLLWLMHRHTGRGSGL